MLQPLFLEEIDDDGIGWITLTRPEVHNAFNDILIAELTTVLAGFGTDERVRAVVLEAKGRSALAELMRTLNELPRPTVALCQGPTFGGGIGLLACCDIVIAAETANFSFSEVRLGLIPSVISPYVMAAMGERPARRYFLTAESFSAPDALRLGLVHQVVPDEALRDAGNRVLRALLRGGPRSQIEAKELILELSGRVIDDDLVEDTAQRIARIRTSEEGREGIAAFLGKRRPQWQKS